MTEALRVRMRDDEDYRDLASATRAPLSPLGQSLSHALADVLSTGVLAAIHSWREF